MESLSNRWRRRLTDLGKISRKGICDWRISNTHTVNHIPVNWLNDRVAKPDNPVSSLNVCRILRH